MSLQQDFLLSVKSTIDKVAYDLAQSLSIGCVDLDDSSKTAALFKSADTAVVLEFNTLTEMPRDPLYEGFLHIGIRTVGDPANYVNLDLMGKVQALFPINERVPVKDYSGAVAGSLEGSLYIMESNVLSQGYALLSGVRLLAVKFKATRIV